MNFSFIDFLIGLTLVNSIPHFVLGVWKGRILGGLGFGNTRNILYGLLNFSTSILLFLYKFGIDGFLQNGIYLGGLAVVISYFLFGKILHSVFRKNEQVD